MTIRMITRKGGRKVATSVRAFVREAGSTSRLLGLIQFFDFGHVFHKSGYRVRAKMIAWLLRPISTPSSMNSPPDSKASTSAATIRKSTAPCFHGWRIRPTATNPTTRLLLSASPTSGATASLQLRTRREVKTRLRNRRYSLCSKVPYNFQLIVRFPPFDRITAGGFSRFERAVLRNCSGDCPLLSLPLSKTLSQSPFSYPPHPRGIHASLALTAQREHMNPQTLIES